MNLRLDLAYDGAPFHGFARQADVRTVQGALEEALALILSRPVTITCAGRTDAGVHALGQVVSIPGVVVPDLDRVKDALNGMLGPSIAVHSCREVSEDFNARFSARSRTYVYAIQEGTGDPFLARTCMHHPGALDLDAMNEAAGHLVGSHDFSSFGRPPEAPLGAQGPSSTRTLFELSCSRATHSAKVIRIKARANAFIQQMVRSLVGTLVKVGEGRLDPAQIPAILAAHDRAAAGPVAPPQGLCLVAVEYDEGWSRPPAGPA